MKKGAENQSNFCEKIKSSFDENSKIGETKLSICGQDVSVFYIESIIDKKLFSQGILSPLEKLASSKDSNIEKDSLPQKIMQEIVSISSTEEVTDYEQAVKNIFSGYAVIALEDSAICCPIFSVEGRGVEEPPTAKVVKGPREGFVEDIFMNIGLVRKRLKTPNLKIEDAYVGKQTNTHVSIVYLKDIAKSEIVEEVKRRLKTINIDAIIDSYYIESFLEEDRLKFFRRVGNTEKPDAFCAKILEGRVGLLVDGSPIALTVPFVMFEDLQSAGDYYTVPTWASFARLMRIFGLIFAILIPGVYVALQSYNYSILPINFLIALLSSIEGLSIPPLIEILFVLFLFEIITEASLQMPNALSMALSIIGALALGNTAVDAGIISPPSIVIVAISSVALYIIPDQISETRVLRVLFTTIGGIIGLYGVVISFIILTTYLCSLTSFGVPYLAPLAPSIKSDKKDTFIKQSLQAMTTRPKLFAGKNKVRQKDWAVEKNRKNSNEKRKKEVENSDK